MKSKWILSFSGLCLLPLTVVAQQTISPPPIKMGLWKSTSNVNMTGLQIPPQVAERLKAMGKSVGGPQTVTSLSCVTREKWQQMFNRQQNENCTYSNIQQTSSHMSADITCKGARGGSESTGHMEMTFDNDTSMHGKFHISSTMQSQPQPLTIDSDFQGTYQGSDCQGISPDSPRIVH
jgi:Protein of unknown function (DUF3617)